MVSATILLLTSSWGLAQIHITSLHLVGPLSGEMFHLYAQKSFGHSVYIHAYLFNYICSVSDQGRVSQ